jgi:ABC-type branched-subunit amino acid transport system substrate-binding protein
MNRAVAVGTVVVLLAGTTGAVARATHRDAITIGALYPIRDRAFSETGLEEYRGAQLAVDLANAQGGVRGRPIRLDTVDAETPDAARAGVEALHRRGVSVFLGTFNSTLSAPAAEEAARRGMVLWETGAVGLQGPDSGGGRTFFRLTSMGQELGRNAITFVHDELAARAGIRRPLRYAVVYVDDVYGQSVAAGARDQVRASAQPLAGDFPYDASTVDMHQLVARIATTHPDVLMVVSYLDDGEALRRATLAAHLPLVASIGTSSSFCSTDFGRDLGVEAVGLFASDKPAAADIRASALAPDARTQLQWARAEWRRRYHGAMEAHALSGFAHAWALVHHVLPASTTLDARGVQRAAVRVKLALGALPNGSGLDLAGPRDAEAGANRRAVSVVWEWVAAGRRAVVWPATYASHLPVLAVPAG